MNPTIPIIDFSTLSNEEKIDLFQKNQELLIKYKPESEFIIRDIKNVKNKVIQYYIKIIKNYKGKAAIHPEFLLLFQIMQINDFEDLSEFAAKRAISDFPENGNCLFVEYIAGKINLGNLVGLEGYFKDKNIKKISYFKHENIRSVEFSKYKSEILKVSSSKSSTFWPGI